MSKRAAFIQAGLLVCVLHPHLPHSPQPSRSFTRCRRGLSPAPVRPVLSFQEMCARPCGCLTPKFSWVQISFGNHSVEEAHTACFPLWAKKNRFSTKIYHLCQYVSKRDGADLNVSTFVSFNSQASSAAVIVSSSPQRKDFPGIAKSPLRSQVKTFAAKKQKPKNSRG